MRQSYKTALLWVFLIVMFIALWKLFEQRGREAKTFNWSQFMTKVEAGEVKEVTVKDLDYFGHLRDGSDFVTTGPIDASATIAEKLREKGVNLTYQKPEQSSLWVTVPMCASARRLFQARPSPPPPPTNAPTIRQPLPH